MWKKIMANTCIIRYSDFLKLKKMQPLIMLTESLMKDGRLYGAEVVDYYEDFTKFESCLNEYLTERTLDPVETVREIRNDQV